MKKLLLLILLAGFYSGHAQTIKFTPPPEDWRQTATPQQMADTLKALEAKYEKAKQRVNLLSALSEIEKDRLDDSTKQAHAAQIKQWSKVPRATKKLPPKVKSTAKQPAPSHR